MLIMDETQLLAQSSCLLFCGYTWPKRQKEDCGQGAYLS